MHRRGAVGLSELRDGLHPRPRLGARAALALPFLAFAMRFHALGLALALCGCHRAPDPAPAPKAPSAPVPRTVDKGDGCKVEITKDGGGDIARVGDEVLLSCDTRLADAEAKLASTEGWASPLRLRVGDPKVLAGLSRGIEGLSSGSKARIVVPPALAYGPAGSPTSGIPADATLWFDVEILRVRP